ncbi:MAG: hypothetical protein ACREP7_08835 [Lysobacter sp.]
MNPIAQQLLIYGTVLFLLSMLAGFAMPILANPRMGVSAHVAGLQCGMALWALGLMWPHMDLSLLMQRATLWLAVAGMYAIYVSLFLAALWGTSRSTPIAGAGHQASVSREMIVTAVLTSGSLATVVAITLVLWGLLARKI